jgi:threonine dehydrogenase-like Zn-dependent dehydrogenase
VPSVLVIDSCLGDYDLCTLHWVGEEPEVVAEGDHTMLVTSTDPAWWSEGGGTGDAPATFVLGTSAAGASVSADDIVWALDQIRASGAEPRTFVVAMGLTGLPLRQYAEGLAGTSQTSRADLVGMAFCGTPHGGCSALATYGDLPLNNVRYGFGMGNKTIRGGECPGGRARMEKLLNLLKYDRVDPTPLISHRFQGLDQVETAFRLMEAKPPELVKTIVTL